MPNSYVFRPIKGEPISDEKLENLREIFELPIAEAKERTVDELYEDPDLGLDE